MRYGKKIVLVVNGDPQRCDHIANKLRDAGFEVYACYSLQFIWGMAASIPGGMDAVDLVIIDDKVSATYTKPDGSCFNPANGSTIQATLEFLRDLKDRTFVGKVLADCDEPAFNECMLHAGATHSSSAMSLVYPWEAAEELLR